MRAKKFFHLIAKPLKIFITLSIVIFIVFFLQAMSTEIAKTFTEEQRCVAKKIDSQQWQIHNARKEFTADGRILLVESNRNNQCYGYRYGTVEYNNQKDRRIEIYDANFTQLWEGKKEDLPTEYQTLSWTEHYRNMPKGRFHERLKINPGMSATIEIAVRKNAKITEIWQYKIEDDIFAGYKYKGKKIGYLGANGFVESKDEAVPFGEMEKFSAIVPEDSRTPVLLWQMKNRFFIIDFENRKTEIVIDAGGEKITDVKFKNYHYNNKPLIKKADEADPHQYRSMIEYRIDEEVYLLFADGKPVKLKIPAQWYDYFGNTIWTVATDDKIFVCRKTSEILTTADWRKSQKNWQNFFKSLKDRKNIKYSAQLYQADLQGNLTLVNKLDWVKPAHRQQIVTGGCGDDFLKEATIFSPVIFYPIQKILLGLNDNLWGVGENSSMTRAYSEMVYYAYPRKLSVNITLSILIMAVTFFHGWHRRTSWANFVGWIIFVGLFNLAGLVTYLLLKYTKLINCPVCGKLRGLEKSACIKCGATIAPKKNACLITARN